MGDQSGGIANAPVVEPGDIPADLDPVAGPGASVGGVLLAAGRGTRFEAGNKLLATIEGEPVVRRAARSLVDSSLDEVVVVVGHEADAVADAVAPLDVAVVHNEAYERGQSTSMHRGVERAGEREWAAIVFGLGDMPAVEPRSVDLLVRAHAAGVGSVLAAAADGERGNPVLFDASTYDDLLAVEGDTGGRPVVLGADDLALVETGDPAVTRDVDRASDLDAF
jgi:molybdenum cofactor cytidylyltransferase